MHWRPLASAASHHRNRWILALLALSVWPADAIAQKMKVAVLPFNGPEAAGKKAQLEVAKALRKDYELTAIADWDASAKKLFATSRSTDDIAAVAGDLGVQVVLTGAIKNDGGWTLIVTVRHGPSGKPVDKLRYPLKGPRIDPGSIRTLPGDLPPLVEKAASGPPGEPEKEKKEEPATTPGDGTNAQPLGEDKEAPLEKKKEEAPAGGPRPDWAPYIDGSIGLIVAGRNLSFDAPNLPQFHSSAAAGLHIDVTGYPLAFLASRPGAAMNAVQGIGVGLTLDFMGWPDSIPKPCPTASIDPANPMNCLAHFSTNEYRLEAGLRWHWNPLMKPLKPELLVSLEYGLHNFTISKNADGTDVGPPDITYSYITLGLGARLPIIQQLAFLARVNLHFVTDSGAIQTLAEYGPGGNFGFRLTVGAESRIWKGVTLHLAGFYERFGLSFDQPMTNPPMRSAGTAGQGAADQYYGFWLTAGYVF